jgi:uncharacterized membrane protein
VRPAQGNLEDRAGSTGTVAAAATSRNKEARQMGPVEIIVIGFPEQKFTGEVAPALADLVESGLVRLIDLIFVTKDESGDVAAVELTEVDDEVREAFTPVLDELTGLVSEEDIEDLAESLDPGQSAAILLFEHSWATRFADAVAGAGGELLGSMRIPREVVAEVLAAADAG